jgi:hypothetical protein
MLPLAKQSLDEAPYKFFGAVAKPAGITFWSIDFFLNSINLGFFLREKLAAVLIKPSSWGSQLDGEKLSTPRRMKTFFWHRCRGLKKKKLPHQLHFSTSTWHHQPPRL